MKRHEPPSIRRQLEISVTSAVALLFAIGALGVYLLVRADVNRQFLAKLERRLELYIEDTEMDVEAVVDANFHDLAVAEFDPESEGEDEDEGEDEEDEDEDEYEDATWYVLRDHRGATVFASPWLEDENLLRFAPNPESETIVLGSIAGEDGFRLRTAAASFQLPLEILDEEEIGVVDTSPTDGYDRSAPENRVHLIIGESDEEIRHLLAVLAFALAGIGIAITVATALLVSRLIERACRPIETISALTASIDPNQSNARLPDQKAPLELGPLVRQFNALLDRVETAFTRERRFSADIAHELRTPVTELRSLAEVATAPSSNPKDEPEDPAEVYQETARIAERLGRLIEVLSDLHRTGSGAVSVEPSAVSLNDILNEAITAAQTKAEVRNIAIEVPSSLADESDLEIRTDPTLLRGILDNLLGNAVIYSLPGTTVICNLDTADNEEDLRLKIRNETEPLSRSDLSHLNEPFWQKDAARSDESHFGLGLSTVSAYAKLLGISVDYRMDDVFFIARVEIPVAR